MKISLIGAGNIGSALAYLLVSKNYCDTLVMYDISPRVVGSALDINQTQSVFRSSVDVIGTNDISQIKGSDVIVVTAGVPRKDGMTRDDILDVNSKVILEVAGYIKQYCVSSSFVICITNPLDVMTWLLLENSGLPNNRVAGMAGVLDTSRCNSFIAEALKVKQSDVSSIILGGHGDLMLAPQAYISVSGIPIKEFVRQGAMTQTQLDDIIQRVRVGGGEIIKKSGSSAYFATAASAFAMVDAYACDSKALLCCSVKFCDAFGLKKCVSGVPCIIGSNGVERIIELPMTDSDSEQFFASTSTTINQVKKAGIQV